MRVALFGGSFSPPHNGHIEIIRKLAAMEEFNEVWILPAAHHPFGKELAPFEKRIEMLERSLKEIKKAHISSIEKSLKSPNKTIDTIRALKLKFPTYQFSFIIGSDILEEIRSWKDYQKVEQEVEIIVVTRKGFMSDTCPYRILAFDLPEISSSTIREALKKNHDTKDIPASIKDLATKLYS